MIFKILTFNTSKRGQAASVLDFVERLSWGSAEGEALLGLGHFRSAKRLNPLRHKGLASIYDFP
jgi:hypothetical protein